jgi:hypothetical protein
MTGDERDRQIKEFIESRKKQRDMYVCAVVTGMLANPLTKKFHRQHIIECFEIAQAMMEIRDAREVTRDGAEA